MAISVNELFQSLGLNYSKAYKWNEKILDDYNGVYIISLSETPTSKKYVDYKFDICEETFEYWKTQALDLMIGENKVENKNQIREYLSDFWQNENILYIGQSSSNTNKLNKRLNQFYTHKVGKKGPHTGGYWLKLLKGINTLNIYTAKSENPIETEFKLLLKFVELKAQKPFFEVENISNYFPFANLKVDTYKTHIIKNATNSTKRK